MTKPVIFEAKTTYSDCRTWVIGEDKESIIEFLCNQWGCWIHELILEELPESKWSECQIIDPDSEYYEETDEFEYIVISDFQKEAEKWDGKTEILATDEY
ncbi:MAG TPA: hypothetical protein VIH28_08260 [Ignavibacteriaceae bacterium]